MEVDLSKVKTERVYSSSDEDDLKIDEDVKIKLEANEEAESSDSDPSYEPPAKVGRNVPSRACKSKALAQMVALKTTSPRRTVSFKEEGEGGEGSRGRGKRQKKAESKMSSIPKGILKGERGKLPEIPMEGIDTAALAKATAYPEVDEGPHFIPGMKPVFATSQGSRQSVGMKFQLKVIERNVARLMQERNQIDQVLKSCHRAVAALGEEERVLGHLSTLMNTMGPPGDHFTVEEFTDFFYKRFLRGEVGPEEPAEPANADTSEGGADEKVPKKELELD